MGQQSTPWQKMRFFEQTLALMEKGIRCNKESKVGEDCYPDLTYFHNGKDNICCKPVYDYVFSYSEGYDQNIHRCDRKHPVFYLLTDKEEEFPCRRVPMRSNAVYGHRPAIDHSQRHPKIKQIHTFSRNSGTAYCINANGWPSVRLHATMPFQYNDQYGYTYSPPRK